MVEVASVNRLDWARNAAGLTDVNWWRGTLSPRPTVDWYAQVLATTLFLGVGLPSQSTSNGVQMPGDAGT